jgi:hypothetical protein
MRTKALRMLMVGLLGAMFPFAASFDFSVHPEGETTTGEVVPLARGAHRLPRDVEAVGMRPDSDGHERTRTTAPERAGLTLHPAPDIADDSLAELRLMRLAWRREKRFRAELETTLRLFPQAGVVPATKGKSLIIDQSPQMMHVYEDGVEIRVIPISTGLWPMYTPAFLGRVGRYAGTIWAYSGWADEAWYLFEARGSIYLHSLPYHVIDARSIYSGGGSLGVRPSSHGCIRLHPDDARWLTRWNPTSALILITLPRPITIR